jgi:hypothetical protein
LADSGTELPEAKRFTQHPRASDIARRFGISFTVFEENGTEIQFWAHRRSEKVAAYVHDFVVAFEALQEKEATEPTYYPHLDESTMVAKKSSKALPGMVFCARTTMVGYSNLIKGLTGTNTVFKSIEMPL